eukprot:GFYU01013462.1.p1 GENE.GFYU01013462.1~~GFYU01013462.1.p1  ORF type:complete len:299 (-),score=121.71 GFYU01013462.1:107-943(-)
MGNCVGKKPEQEQPAEQKPAEGAAKPSGPPKHPLGGDVVPFAVMRQAHEAIRGAAKDLDEGTIKALEDGYSADKLDAAEAELKLLSRFVHMHAKMEDDVLFKKMNAKFEDLATKEHYYEEHETDAKDWEGVWAAVKDAREKEDASGVVTAYKKWRDTHMAHLEHEEKEMMPRIPKLCSNFLEVQSTVNEFINAIEDELFDFGINFYCVKLEKHKPYEGLRVFVRAVQYSVEKDRYAEKYVPLVKASVGAETIAALEKDDCLSTGHLGMGLPKAADYGL